MFDIDTGVVSKTGNPPGGRGRKGELRLAMERESCDYCDAQKGEPCRRWNGAEITQSNVWHVARMRAAGLR